MDELPVTWDDTARAGYLRLSAGQREIAKTVEIPEDRRFLLNLDPNGRVIGIEFLSDVPISALMHWGARYATKFRGEIILDW